MIRQTKFLRSPSCSLLGCAILAAGLQLASLALAAPGDVRDVDRTAVKTREEAARRGQEVAERGRVETKDLKLADGSDRLATDRKLKEDSKLKEGSKTTAETAAGRKTFADEKAIVKDAEQGRGYYGLGEADRATAQRAGRLWVGEGARTSSDGKAEISADSLRQYRDAELKARSGLFQANFESREQSSGPWTNNGHLDVTK